MKICLLTRSHKPCDPRIHFRLARSLTRAKHNVKVVCRVPYNAPHLRQVIECIHYIGIPRSRTPRRDFRGTVQIFREAWRIGAEIYICFELRTLAMGLILKLFTGASVIYDCHEYRPEKGGEIFPKALRKVMIWVLRKVEHFLVRGADVIWCVNKHLAARLFDDVDRTIVLPNYPINDMFEHIKTLPEKLRAQYAGRKVLIYAGGMSEKRGVTASLYMMAHLRELVPETYMLFIGQVNSNYAEQLRKIIRQLALDNVVEFLGHIPHEKVPRYLALGDLGIFLLEPVNERYNLGEPIKYFEYTAAGLAVVMSDLPAKRRLVEQVGNGILVEPADYIGTAKRIAQLLQNKGERKAMAERGRAMFLSSLNWEAVVPRMLDSIDRLERKRRFRKR